MASTIIHLAIAKKVREKIKVENERDYYIGSIAPDLAKQIGLSRIESHFLINTKEDTPNLKIFKKRYPTYPNNSFNLGYFIHLYTDKLWKEDFTPNFIQNNSIKLLDGTIINTTEEEMLQMLYSDYTNLNTEIIDKYHLDLSIFYEDFMIPNTTIKEIPIDKLDILINKMGLLIENSKEEKTYTLDIYSITNFIDKTANRILNELKNTSIMN